MYRLGLEAFGFHVRVESDGPGLFRAVAEEEPDIVVLDWQLPGMRGDEVLEHVRLDERTRALPVFILSNFQADVDGAVDRVFVAGEMAWFHVEKSAPPGLAETSAEA